jgi:hypothetical protein
VLLGEARAEFLRSYARGDGFDCSDLYPLAKPAPDGEVVRSAPTQGAVRY